MSPIPSFPTFSCHTLTPQNDFQVEPEDIILACIFNDKPLDVLTESASGYEVYHSLDSTQPSPGCTPTDIPGSVSLPSYNRLSNSAIHVYVGEYGRKKHCVNNLSHTSYRDQ